MFMLRLAVLAVAIGSGYLAFQFAGEKETVIVEREPVVTKVLVANQDIGLGGKLAAANIAWVNWPEETVPAGALTYQTFPKAKETYQGRIARSKVFKGEPIRAERFIKTDKGYMAALLPKGKRAIAVAVEQETAAGGFILPGDKVDVILTRRMEKKNAFSEAILENIRVLAIDSATAGDGNWKNLSPKRTATLELSLAQSEVIARAQQVGSIALVLRSAEDSMDASPQEPSLKRNVQFVQVHAGRWTVSNTSGHLLQ